MLTEVIEFLVVIKMYLMQFLLDHQLSLVHLRKMFVSSNVEVCVMKEGDLRDFYEVVQKRMLNLKNWHIWCIF